MRLIDADALKELIFSKTNGMEDLWDTAGVLNAINNTQTVEIPAARWDCYCEGQKVGYEKALSERHQGKWNYIQADMCVCPFCGAPPHRIYKNYCPNCGADMRGDDNDEQ